MLVAIETNVSVVRLSMFVIYREAFQGVEATSDMAPKTDDNILPYTDKRNKLADKVCDKDDSLLIPLLFPLGQRHLWP